LHRKNFAAAQNRFLTIKAPDIGFASILPFSRPTAQSVSRPTATCEIELTPEKEKPTMTMPQRHWWHELNTWEPEAALAFYGRTLGWEFEPSTLPDGAGYWIARKDGRPVGGVFELTAPDYDGVPSHWMTYLSVKDIDVAEVETSKSGGEIMRPPVRVPGVGKLAVVTDASGAMIGLIEPDGAHALAAVH
jgi:uncharacterized protein